MKISNITILNTDLTNNTTKISFTISEATENVNVYLKINDEEYVEIFLNKTNEVLEYTVNISRGVNNLLLKATDSTDEYISEPIQVLLKEEPSIENLECSYSDSTGKYILNFAFNGDTNFKYNIYLKLDDNDYIEVLSNQISGDKIIEQIATIGNHTCTLKVSDGYDDYTFSPFQFEITNHKPVLSKVLVTDITNNGEAYIYYSTKDIETSVLTHKLVIGDTETVITPTQIDNFYSYKITGLSEGISNCTISISDGIDTISSDVFSIEVFSDTTNKKELLRRAKVRYDSAYQQLRDIIVSVISDLKYDYDIENALIAKAQDNYKVEYSNFNKISQQSIDAIGNNKVTVTKKELQSEIKDVDDAVNGLENTMWGVFQDGILDKTEKDALNNSLDLVAKEKIDIDKDYETLYNNEDLTYPSKTNLQTSYNNFISVHNSLVTTINGIINKDEIIDNTDKANMDTVFGNWRTALGNYRIASLEAIDAIAKKKADDSADTVDKKWAEIVLDPETGIKSQVGDLQTKITGDGGIEKRLQSAEQILTKDGISNIVKDVYYTKTEVDNKVTNVDNKIKTTVKSVNVMYYLSTSTTELIGGTWSDVAPTWEANKYMWSKTVITLSDGTIKESSPTCIAGAKGEDGIPGVNGQTTYTWIKYADDENGNGISNNPTNKSYIGFAYNKTTNIESNSPSDYTWSLIKGTDGVDGQDGKDGKDGTSVTILGSYNSVGELNQAHPNNNNNGDGYIVNGDLYIWDGKSFINVGQIKGEDGKNGVDGQDGKNGLNAYVHIKYSNDGGKTFTPSNGEEVGDYLGIYTDYYEADSTDVTKYTWSKIKGQDGVPGTNGKDGVTTYTWVKYSNNADGTGLYNTPNSQTKYIGIATNKTTATESTNKTDYVWSLFRGEDGADGASIESITEEYYLSTSKTTQIGGSWVTTPPTWEYGKYMWTRNKIVYNNPTKTEYTSPICDSSWEAVDNIQVGARNYLLNTDFSDSTNLEKWYCNAHSVNSFNIYENFGENLDKDSFIRGNYVLRNRHDIANAISLGKAYSMFKPTDVVLEKNTEYTISFYMYKNENCGKCHMSVCPILEDGSLGTKCGGTSSITEYTGAFEKQTVTFTTNAESNKFSVRFYNYYKDTLTSGYSDVHIYHPMLVKGNKAMDWTPAPEDVQNQIDENKTVIESTKEIVADHTTNLDSVTSRVSATEKNITSINNNISNMEERVQSAEHTLTKDGLTTIIGDSYTTQAEVDGILTEKGYATQSEVIQTKTEIIQSFTSSGGYNLLYNTSFLNGSTYWSVGDGRVVDTSRKNGVNNSMKIVSTGATSEVWKGTTQRFAENIPTGKTYRATLYYYVADKSTFDSSFTLELKGRKTETTSESSIARTSVSPSDLVVGQWTKITVKATTTQSWDYLYIYPWIHKNGTIWLSNLIVTEGELEVPWSPNPNEINDGIITVNKDGVKVEMQDGEGSQGYSLVSYDGFSIFNSSGDRTAWFGQDDSSYINKLYTNDVICDRVVRKRNADTPNTFYVNANPPSGSNQSGTSVANACSSINEMLKKIKSTYGEYSNWQDIWIDVAIGSYNENIEIVGFMGCGVITINLNDNTGIYGKWRIYDNTMKVVINGNRTSGNATNNGARLVLTDENWDYLCYVRNSSCTIKNLRSYNKCRPKSSTDRYGCAFVWIESGRCSIINCDFSRYYYGILATENSMGCIAECRGYAYYAGVSRYGSYVGLANFPCQKENSWPDWGGQLIENGVTYESLYDADYESSTPIVTPPTTTPTVFTQSFTVTNLKSIPEGSGSSTSTRTGVMGQGKWGSYKPHRGWGTIPSSLREFCSGGSNISMTITMTRQNSSHGYIGAVPSPKFVYSGGNWDSGVTFARGDTKTITFPSTIVSQIANGTITNIQLWAGASTNNYSFYENVTISVTCTKNV